MASSVSPRPTADDALAGTSNYGDSVFIAAPGVDIVTLQAGGGRPPSTAPPLPRHTSRRAALLKAKNGCLSNGEIAGTPRRDRRPGRLSSATGNGRLNLYRALTTPDTGSVKPQGAPAAAHSWAVWSRLGSTTRLPATRPTPRWTAELNASDSDYFEGEVVPHYFTRSVVAGRPEFCVDILRLR